MSALMLVVIANEDSPESQQILIAGAVAVVPAVAGLLAISVKGRAFRVVGVFVAVPLIAVGGAYSLFLIGLPVLIFGLVILIASACPVTWTGPKIVFWATAPPLLLYVGLLAAVSVEGG